MGGQEHMNQDDIEAKVEYLFANKFNHTLHAYIDITGDLIAGILLSQIMYWFAESADKNAKTTICKDGYYWIAKRREDWMKEIRITKKQYDCAIKKLTAEGSKFLEVKKYQYHGVPMTHIRPVTENINKAITEWKMNLAVLILSRYDDGCNGSSPNGNMEVPQTVNSMLPKGEVGSSPNGNMEVPQTVNSYIHSIYNNIYRTEITNKEITNKENYNISSGEDILSGSISEPDTELPKKQITYSQIMDDYNNTCVDLPSIQAVSEERRRKIRILMNGMDKDKILLGKTIYERLHAIFQLAHESDFLSGRNGKWNGCSFDWLIDKKNALKILEGTYANKAGMSKSRNGACGSADNATPRNRFNQFQQQDYKITELEEKILSN